jgi:hypothetical protein
VESSAKMGFVQMFPLIESFARQHFLFYLNFAHTKAKPRFSYSSENQFGGSFSFAMQNRGSIYLHFNEKANRLQDSFFRQRRGSQHISQMVEAQRSML